MGDQQQTNPDKLLQTGSANYTRWLQIEGNSGSGKSSLVQAGMLPMIERGVLWARTGFENWRILGPMSRVKIRSQNWPKSSSMD